MAPASVPPDDLGVPPSGAGTPTGVGGTTAGTRTPSGIGEEASSLARSAGEAGQNVAEVAKEETKAVASETGRQARQLMDQAGQELRDQAATQQARVASGLHSVGREFSSMADSSTEPGVASDLARQAGERAERVAQWLDVRDPGSLVEEVKMFARRKPWVFLAVAAATGAVAGRLTRALATPDRQHGQDGDGVRGPTPGSMGGA